MIQATFLSCYSNSSCAQAFAARVPFFTHLCKEKQKHQLLFVTMA